MNRKFTLAAAIAACAIAFAGAAQAQTTATPITREQAIAIAQKQVPGSTVIKTELDDEHGRTYYEVKLVDDKKVRHEIKINAADGSIREHESKNAHRGHRSDDGKSRHERKN